MRFLLAALALASMVTLSFAHDSWISRGALRNPAGEWCCGEGDCFVIPGRNASAVVGGYRVQYDYVGNDAEEHHDTEVVPYAEAQPSPDGQFWRCKRPDGSRRCFFAPPPSD